MTTAPALPNFDAMTIDNLTDWYQGSCHDSDVWDRFCEVLRDRDLCLAWDHDGRTIVTKEWWLEPIR